MRIDELRNYCRQKPGASEDFPFDEVTLTARVGGKIFLFTGINQGYPFRFTVKCDPDLAVQLRKSFNDIAPGYHTNKRHWNTVTVNGSIDDEKLEWFIDHSYGIVFDSLPKNVREKIGNEKER